MQPAVEVSANPRIVIVPAMRLVGSVHKRRKQIVAETILIGAGMNHRVTQCSRFAQENAENTVLQIISCKGLKPFKNISLHLFSLFSVSTNEKTIRRALTLFCLAISTFAQQATEPSKVRQPQSLGAVRSSGQGLRRVHPAPTWNFWPRDALPRSRQRHPEQLIAATYVGSELRQYGIDPWRRGG